jgi:hypothetical protein
VPYALRLDVVENYTLYKGEAVPASVDTDPVWRIQRVVISQDGDIDVKWANAVNGVAPFTCTWVDRLTYTYN